jgi:hypothetical protein
MTKSAEHNFRMPANYKLFVDHVYESSGGDPFACPNGLALWLEYRERNPDGLTIPPTDGRGIRDPELLPFLKHTDRCKDCNEV